MKIVADEAIPLITSYFSSVGELILKPGRAITRQDLLTADMLIIRSVTQVNEALLAGTSIKFVGSTTTGADHLDTAWLDKQGISWAIAYGCNATSVVEYVITVIALLKKSGFLAQKSLRAGVVGVGNIGAQVVQKLMLLGFDVVQCDPLRAEKEKDFHATSLKDFVDLDFITLHTPLTKSGDYPTYHLINKEFLQQQKKGCVILNTGRGAVIDFNALKLYGRHLIWCLDVWENEPYIDVDILQAALIATPHIAGHAVESKYRGIAMIYQAALAGHFIPEIPAPKIEIPLQTISFFGKSMTWYDVILKIYDPLQTSQQMKQEILEKNRQAFDVLRNTFSARHEFEFVRVEEVVLNKEDSFLLKKIFVK